MNEHQLRRIERCSRRSMFHAGNRLFREGEPADRFWVIVDGAVDLDFQVPDRGDIVVDTLGAGSVLGWSWLLAPHRWHFGAVAVQTAMTVELDAAAVRHLCDLDPALGYTLATRSSLVLLDRLQATRLRLVQVLSADDVAAMQQEPGS
ncbi:cyclic nucleotide-binding domain-containing protein [Dactylosporangium sp. CS-047395]|uniref:cyclic nucleotide-binding domain-containing protein n=1 Tax=Dactylosporangium sp. CS-047395 TaxID=3239936 RepID=UPI003D8BF753